MHSDAQRIYERTRRRYSVYASLNGVLFWVTRLGTVLGALLLPFVAGDPEWLRRIALAIAGAVATDLIWRPEQHRQFFSDAACLLESRHVLSSSDLDDSSRQLIELIVRLEQQRLGVIPGDSRNPLDRARQAPFPY